MRNLKQPIKNPVINTDCCKQSEINEVIFNNALHGALTPTEQITSVRALI